MEEVEADDSDDQLCASCRCLVEGELLRPMNEMNLYYDGVRVAGVVDVVEAAVSCGMPTASLQLTDAVRWDASRPLSLASFAALRWSMDLPFGGPSTITNLTLSNDGSLHWQRASSALFLDRLSQQVQDGTESALSAGEITALTDVLLEFSWKTYPDEGILLEVWRLLSTCGANDLVIKTAVGLAHSAHTRARAGAVSYLARFDSQEFKNVLSRIESERDAGVLHAVAMSISDTNRRLAGDLLVRAIILDKSWFRETLELAIYDICNVDHLFPLRNTADGYLQKVADRLTAILRDRIMSGRGEKDESVAETSIAAPSN